MIKNLMYSNEARQRILEGVTKLSNAVKVTLGPLGKNVAIDRQYGAPHITKDGVTVAREIELEDPFENMGAQMVKEVASKTNDIAGDGTTTATVLAEAIYREGLKHTVAGINPVEIKHGIDYATNAIVSKLKTMSKSVDNQIVQVATISANGDAEIGNIIAEAMEKVGKDGTITVNEARTFETTLTVVDGMQFNSGYLSPYFVTDKESMTATFDDCLILLVEKHISNVNDILPILQQVSKSGKPLLIIAENIDGEALGMLVINKMRGVLNICGVKSPGFGDRRKAIMQDIAILTGGTYISEDLGINLENLSIDALGHAKQITITKDSTTIVDGGGNKDDIDARINQIRKEISETQSEYDKSKLQERLAKLSGGVAVINVGAATEVEMKEKKDRVDDALHATLAAIEEGIVPGGGVALIKSCINNELLTNISDKDKVGASIIIKAIEEPLKQLSINGGYEGSIIIQNIKNSTDNNYGFNILTNEYVNMIDAGIIDPTKVTRSALQNAASIAGLLLTTECLITDSKENSQETQQNLNKII